MTPPKCPWNTKQVADFVKAVRREWGPAWTMIGRQIQEMAIDSKCLHVLTGQGRPVEPEEMSALQAAMLTEAGLND